MSPAQHSSIQDLRPRFAAMGLIAWGHFAHDVFTSFFAPLLPLIREALGLSFTEAGVLTALQRFPALANPILGALADRSSVRWMLVAAPTITALSMSGIGIAGSRCALGIMLVVAGAGSAIWHVPAPVMLARVAGRRVGLGMSLFMVAGESARSLGPFLALAAVSLWGPAGLLRLIPLGLLTSALLYFATAESASKRVDASRAVSSSRESWQPLLRMFAAITLVVGGRSFLVAALTTYLPSYVIERGESLWLGGTALAILQGAGAIGALGSGTLSDRLGRKTVLLVAACVSPPAMLGLVFAPRLLMLPVLLLLGVLAFSTNPPLLALVQENAGGRPAVANGIFMTLGFVLRSAVVVLVGMLADARGLGDAFLFSAVVALVAIPGVLILPKEVESSHVEQAR